jgi:hypothetical protein
MKLKMKTVQMIGNDCNDEMKKFENVKVGHAMRHATVPAVLRATHVDVPMFQNDSIKCTWWRNWTECTIDQNVRMANHVTAV